LEGRDRSTEFAESPREKYEADRLFLNLLLSDLHNAARLRLNAGPAIDDITRAFLQEKVSETKLTPLWLVFALQIVVDIRSVFRNDTSQAFQELQATGQRVTEVVRRHFQFCRTQESQKEVWHESNDAQILKMVGFVSVWVNQDLISKAVRKQSKQSPEELGIELPPFFLMKQHPLLCGSLVYWLNLNLQEFGISLANAYDSILSAAPHLYNATRQLNHLSVSWPDMEHLISVHTNRRLFVGDLPTQPKDFLKRFQMALGASVINFARNRRSIRPKESSKDAGSRRLRKTMPIHDIFRSRYCTLETHAQITDANLDVIIEEVVKRHPEMDHIVAYAQQWTKTQKLTSLQLLSILGVAVTDEDLHLHFDYISMHIRCATLLSQMRQKFITSADIQTQAITTRNSEMSLTRYLSDLETSLSRFLSEALMPEEHLAVRATMSIFLTDPAAAVVAQNIDPDAPVYSDMLRFADVSLERASELMREVIETEGNIEMNKAGELCKPIHIFL
jgi:hypothetical protein